MLAVVPAAGVLDFRALGLETNLDIMKAIVNDTTVPAHRCIMSELISSVDDAAGIHCQRDALEYLAKHMNVAGFPRENAHNHEFRIGLVKNILEKEFLPHAGRSMFSKALFLGHMVMQMLRCYLGFREFDDRDSFTNKRIDTPGILLGSLFRQYYGRMIKDMKSTIQKEINTGCWRSTGFVNVISVSNISKVVKSSIVDNGLKHGLATGNWGIKNSQSKRGGVAQVANKFSYISGVSHCRRVSSCSAIHPKVIPPRKLHTTQFGIICPSETPEGVSVGLVQNMAMMTNITMSSNSSHVRQLLATDAQVRPVCMSAIEALFHETKVVVNGNVVGTCAEPRAVYERLKGYKRSGRINVYTGVAWNVAENEIRVCTEGGRCARPLFVVENGGLVVDRVGLPQTWHEMLIGDDRTPGVLEMVDVCEANCSLIAMTRRDLARNPSRVTHMEIHPALMLGVLTSLIPFSNHNQSPRNTYGAAQSKQAIGIPSSNTRDRFDAVAHVLDYPQKALVTTRISRLLNNDAMPNGVNAIVAIMTFTGFNQEDSIIMNKSAVDRGLFGSTVYKTYQENNKKNHSNGEEEYFTRPRNPGTPYNYSKIGADGFAPVNTMVEPGDVIIGKCMPGKNGEKDNSIAVKNNEQRGFIDQNCYNNRPFTTCNTDGYDFCKVRVRGVRTPSVGDMFSSRMGQKGTCGILYRQEDMPFTMDGMVPDIIMNPHAIPSRMTIGQLMECIMGKACASLGVYGDGTPFSGTSVDDIAAVLQDRCHFQRHGNEIMYNPRTGEQIRTEIFIGPTYYQRLKHMAADKIHSRASTGPIVMLTHQPPEGRARDGGLRFGEMEIECTEAHGISHFTKESIMDRSDNYRVHVCRTCGLMCVVNRERDIHMCRACDNRTDFAEVRIPYACKLLYQEIQGMSIAARIQTE